MSTEHINYCIVVENMTTKRMTDYIFNRHLNRRIISNNVKWCNPKITLSLKLENHKIAGNIIKTKCINNNIIMILSISNCKQYLFITEYDLVQDFEKNMYKIKCKERLTNNTNYTFYCDNVNDSIILIPTTFFNNERVYTYHKHTRKIITSKLIHNPANVEIYNSDITSFDKKKILFWIDENGILKASVFNADITSFEYLPMKSISTRKSFVGLQIHQNVTSFPIFGNNSLLIINRYFKESICFIVNNLKNTNMIPLKTKNKSIENRFKRCVRYKVFKSKLDHIFFIIDEKNNNNQTRTTILCLDVLQRQWILCKGNFPPNLSGKFLRKTKDVFGCDFNEVCYCVGNWRRKYLMQEYQLHQKNIIYHLIKINVWDLLPKNHKKKIKELRECLTYGFIRKIEKIYFKCIPFVLKQLCNDFAHKI